MEPDSSCGKSLATRFCFNPRARVEPDDGRFERDGAAVVSIHGLAWSPTFFKRQARQPAFCFNPRARVEPDRRRQRGFRRLPCFNPRARVEPDRLVQLAAFGAGVSIHGLAWSPTKVSVTWKNPPGFQSTGSRGARRADHAAPRGYAGFNPRARVEPDRDCSGRRHTPDCFNPRARVEPDLIGFLLRLKTRLFQSTGSRGARPGKRPLFRTIAAVSIHGLAWSPTAAGTAGGTGAGFQSTGSRGARLSGPFFHAAHWLFQSTGSRGARLFDQILEIAVPCFNPRARVEPDRKTARFQYRPKRFNPRARVEPDYCSRTAPPRRNMFQSTGSRGARPRGNNSAAVSGLVSIHGLAWSPTASGKTGREHTMGFNPRARVEPDGTPTSRA